VERKLLAYFVRIARIVRMVSCPAYTFRFEPNVGVPTSDGSNCEIVVPRETDSHHPDLPFRHPTRSAGEILVSRETKCEVDSIGESCGPPFHVKQTFSAESFD